MKRMMMLACSALVLALLIGPASLAAQQPATGQMPMGGGQPAQPGGQMPPMPMTGWSAPMMGPGMMGMMCPPHMLPPMMGGQMDPKTMGRLMQMRGEMLKAMGDILVKYGKIVEEGK